MFLPFFHSSCPFFPAILLSLALLSVCLLLLPINFTFVSFASHCFPSTIWFGPCLYSSSSFYPCLLLFSFLRFLHPTTVSQPFPHFLHLSHHLCIFVSPTQAVNQAGAGPYSEQVSFRTPATNPDQVSSLTLLDLPTSSDSGHSPSTCLFLKWEEPNSNGAEITSYVITLDDQTITVESGTSHLVTGLQPDTDYRY